VLQYHHIIPYSVEQHFRVEDMMALCPGCHDMATKGALTQTQQRNLQENPYNVKRGYSSGLLALNHDCCAISAGGTLLVGEGPLVVVDEQPLLELYAGPDADLEISVNLFDRRGTALAVIERNEWVSGDVSVWDLEADYQKLIIREKKGRVSLKIDAHKPVLMVSAHLWHAGQMVKLSPVGLTFNGAAIKKSGIRDLGLVGLRLEFDTRLRQAQVVPYLGNGVLVSEPDPEVRLRKSIDAWRSIRDRTTVLPPE
jgi:hypothetical protein